MDKKSIVTIVVLALVFAGFYYVLNQDQKRYQQEVAAYRAYQDSIRQTLEPEVAEGPTVAGSTDRTDSTARAQRLERRVSAVGALLAEAENAQAEEFTVENDVMKVLFSTRGGQIKGVTLKDYDRYASESPFSTPRAPNSPSRSTCATACTPPTSIRRSMCSGPSPCARRPTARIPS